MSGGARGLWWITLLTTLLVFIPLTVVLLHRLWSAAAKIQRYALEARRAVEGIVSNTADVAALGETVRAGSRMIDVAGGVAEKLDGVADVVEKRAGG